MITLSSILFSWCSPKRHIIMTSLF